MGQYCSEVRKGHVPTFLLHAAMEFKLKCFLDAPALAKGEEQAAAVFQTHSVLIFDGLCQKGYQIQ